LGARFSNLAVDKERHDLGAVFYLAATTVSYQELD
jgi:hypothetical protein